MQSHAYLKPHWKALIGQSLPLLIVVAAAVSGSQVALTIAAIIAVLLAAAWSFLVSYQTDNALGGAPEELNRIIDHVTSGDLELGESGSHSNQNSTLGRLTAMQALLKEKQASEASISAENFRIKRALDVCDTNIMMADADYNIVYMNQSVLDMMRTAESDLKKDIPGFNANDLLGNNIDVFHKNPAHQRSMLDTLKDTYRTTINAGGRTFGLIATPIFDEHHNRLGTVVEWDDKTERIAEQNKLQSMASENQRIRVALDNVSANVMVADTDRNIIYANDAVVNLLRNAQADLRKDLPSFNVDTMMGQKIDQFHANPQHQISILDRLTSTHRAKIEVGGRHMTLIVNPIIDDDGTRLGSVVEWGDETAQVRIQNEMDTIIAAANDGDLNQRIDLSDKQGFYKILGEGLNTLLDKTSVFVRDMASVFQAMSEGNLTTRVESDYRGEFEAIKNNANNSIAKLTEVLSKIQHASSVVRSSAAEVAQGSDDLSRRTESQASNLEETASSMEEITSTVKQTSENAAQANSLATEAKSKAETGGEVVQNAVSAMSEILESSNKINDIIGVIDEIAFQTNLLALNAAVEAARAGEQGRGFAVVAGEVRTLSQRSAAAAKEIKDLIRDSVSKVESGSTLVNQSGQTLSEIVSAVEKVANMINEVTNAAMEQNSGIGQINQAITQMDGMTQQNAALVEETSAASRSMSEEAANMNNMISFFQLPDSSAMLSRTPAPAATVSAPKSTQASTQKAEPVETYKPASHSGNSGAATFSADDEWEDF